MTANQVFGTLVALAIMALFVILFIAGSRSVTHAATPTGYSTADNERARQ